MEGKPHTMRAAYHFDGEQFMFGNAVGVKPTVVYMPEDDEGEEYRKPGASYESDEDEYEEEEKPSYVKPKGSCGCGCGKSASDVTDLLDAADLADLGFKALADADSYFEKAGRVISTSNLEKLNQAMELLREVIAAGGRSEIEMKEKSASISVDIENIFAVKQLLDPIFEYHRLDVSANEHGIEIKSALSSDALTALGNALGNIDYDAELITEDEYSADSK